MEGVRALFVVGELLSSKQGHLVCVGLKPLMVSQLMEFIVSMGKWFLAIGHRGYGD